MSRSTGCARGLSAGAIASTSRRSHGSQSAPHSSRACGLPCTYDPGAGEPAPIGSLAVEALRLGAEGLEAWETAAELAALVPDRKAKAFQAPLADLAGVRVTQLPVELHDFVWTALDAGRGGDLLAHIARARELLRRV